MSSTREDRQRQIRALVRSGGIRTQQGLVTALKEHGFDVTQATVSRDISDLDLQKDERGFYALAEDLRFKTILTATGRATKRAGNQVLLFTRPRLGIERCRCARLGASRRRARLDCRRRHDPRHHRRRGSGETFPKESGQHALE